jgi:hypothetical protein
MATNVPLFFTLYPNFLRCYMQTKEHTENPLNSVLENTVTYFLTNVIYYLKVGGVPVKKKNE